MWHEARKQEKKIRGMLVDYRRRAERRRDYYEKIVRARKCAGKTRLTSLSILNSENVEYLEIYYITLTNCIWKISFSIMG